jgi:hypothetical protein
MMGYVQDELPLFVRKVISNGNKFLEKPSTYNNLVAMAATAVRNYNETAGFSRHGPGPQSVFMNGRVHHYMRIASSTSQTVVFLTSYLMIYHHLQVLQMHKMLTG